MRNNQPKLVGFDTNPTLAVLPGARAVLTLTTPICFTGKRLVLEALDDATGNNVNVIIQGIRWNNHDLLAGGPILSSALPSIWASAGSNGGGGFIKWTIPSEVADTFNIIVLNQSAIITVSLIAYWVTDYGGMRGC